MTTTEFIINNSEKVLSAFTGLEDVADKLTVVSTNADISGRTLKPEDFYNGVEDFDDGNFQAFIQYFSENMDEFNNYIISEINADTGGILGTANGSVLTSGLISSLLNEITSGNGGVVLALKVFVALAVLYKIYSSLTSTSETAAAINGTKTYTKLSSGGESGGSYSSSDYSPSNDITDVDYSDGEETVDDFDFSDDAVEDDYLEFETDDELDDEIVNDIDEDLSGNEGTDDDIVVDDGTEDGIDKNKIIDEIKDASGNVVAVSVIGDGKKNWYQVSGDNVIIPSENVSTYKLGQEVSIVVGEETVTIPTGNYNVDQVIYNADGSIRSVRFIYDDKKVWAYLDSNGNIIKTEYIKNQTGMFSITNPSYDMIDMYGNNIGKFESKDYFIYDVLYDSKGNEIAYRLSPDGEYEKWVYPNGNSTDANVVIYDKIQTSDGTTVATVDDSSGNKGLYGVLGLLFVALGTTLVVRKKVKDKENADYGSDDYSSESEESTLSAGNYGIYDVKKDEDGKITEARISPNDSSNEYWVEV